MAATRHTSRDIRSESRLVVMRALLSAGESTRNDLAQETGLSVGTVSAVVNDLLKHGIIAETGLISGNIGRPTTGLRLNADRGRVVGVYIEDTYLDATVFDAALGDLATVETDIDDRTDDADYLIERIGHVLDTALERAQTKHSDVLGIGILLPGGMQRPVKASSAAPNELWRHLDRLRDHLGLPVVVDNPLKAIATAELWFGAGRQHANLATVNLGTGVGAGIIQDGAVTRGATNAAGEWGHSLLTLDGRPCQCGRKGCVEAYIGAAGIRQSLADIAPGHPLTAVAGHSEFIKALATALAADSPDPTVIATAVRTAYYLGAALTDLVAIVNPEAITLTGETVELLGDRLVPLARCKVLDEVPGDAADDLTIETSSIHHCPGGAGIAAIALERFMRDLGLVTTRILPAV
jgi:predicted NBD/HSP70 family sugar kinase